MSYDVRIATREWPDLDVVKSWALREGLQATADHGGLSVSRRRFAGLRIEPLLVIYPAAHAERDDLDEDLAAATRSATWLLEINASFGAGADVARRLGIHLAQLYQGAAFDPQADGVIWPQRVAEAKSQHRSVELLTLDWFITPDHWQVAAAHIVDVFATTFPPTLPTRYGPYEPFQAKFDAKEPAVFTAAVLNESNGSFGIHWRATAPAFGGHAIPPDTVHPARMGFDDRWPPVGRIGASLDRERVESSDSIEKVEALFLRGAEVFGCFYAAAQVKTGWESGRGNRLWFVGNTTDLEGESILAPGGRWQGLPPVPVWLSWYGPPYVMAVAASLDANRAADIESEEKGDALFVRNGKGPKVSSALVPIEISSELVYRRRPPQTLPEGGISFSPAEPADRADIIPPLTT